MKNLILLGLMVSVFATPNSYANELENTKTSLVSTPINDEISALCKAAMKGDVDEVRSLIALGDELNEKSLGLTPAMYAARYNKAEVLKVLLLNGANLNIKSDKGYTAKEYAKMSNAEDVLKVIDSNS